MSSDDAETAERFRQSLDLPFPLVGDKEGAILRGYKARWPLLGMARRVSYMIGRDGRVQDAHASEMDPESHVAAACAPPK